jgi:pimeloyl-ACP methyl ester carboxylesterase
MRRRTAAALLCAALFLSACGSDAVSDATGSDTVPDPGRDFPITTRDKLSLEARAWGSGTTFVVLAHMRPADMTSWFDFARLLADEGYTAIAFNFRGYGESEGDEGEFNVAADVRGAVAAALAANADDVFIIGASMGGMGAIAAAAGDQITGTVALSAPAEFEELKTSKLAPLVKSPLLLIAADEDGEAANDALAIASDKPDAEILVLPGAQHGTNLFAEHGVEITERILEFLEAG